jgi:hypothetical protein
MNSIGNDKIINISKAFDNEWYAETYPDSSMSGIHPLEHYAKIGIQLGRKPCENINETQKEPIQKWHPSSLWSAQSERIRVH